MTLKMDELVRLMLKERVATPQTIRGCSGQDIRLIEEMVGAKLPSAYQEFLLAMGKQAGKLHYGSDFLYPDILELTSDARDILKIDDPNGFALPQNAFVILMHQGYIFSFFLLDEGDDPPVYSYSIPDSDGHALRYANRYSEYLLKSIEASIGARDL